MSFNRQKFQAIYRQISTGQGYPKFSFYDFITLDSTNQRCWDLRDRGTPIPFVVIAQQQTAGRGQWGRQWQSPQGGLYLSFAFAPNLPANDAPHLTLLSAWGIARALRDRGLPVRLKWPNDLLLQGKKLGGIKSETRIRRDRIAEAVVGVGINWKNPVPDVGINLQSFFAAQSGECSLLSLEMLAAIAVCGILSGYQQYLAEGIKTILPAYWELIEGKDRPVSVDGRPGTLVGVAPNGAIKIRLQEADTVIQIERMPGTISLGYNH